MVELEKIFLSAEWLHLAILNYVVDPSLLRPHVPNGTTLDSFDGKTYLNSISIKLSYSEKSPCLSILNLRK